MVSLKASAQSEGKYYLRPNDPRSWQQPEVKWGNSLLFLDTEITRAQYGLFSRKWYLLFVATCTQVSDFYLQLLAFSVTNLWDLSGMCSLPPPWYSIMQLKCMSISQMTAKHGTISEFHSHANWDIATGWWSLQQLGEMHSYLRGWGSDVWTSEEVILSFLLESQSLLNSKALLRYYNLQVFASFVICRLVFKE
jgi:hypothetical protein